MNTPLYINNSLVDQPRAALVITHGIGSHSGRNSEWVRRLNEEQISVFAFDLPGDGRTRTSKWLFEEFQILTDALDGVVRSAIKYCDRHRIPLFLFGHSMGGLITIDYAIRFQPKVAGMVLSAPALDPGEMVKPWMISLAGWLRKWVPGLPILKIPPAQLSRDHEVVKEYQSDPMVFQGKIKVITGYEMLSRMRFVLENARKVTTPVLIIQGEADAVVRPVVSRSFFESLGSEDKSLNMYPGMYHELLKDLGKEKVMNDIVVWLNTRIAEMNHQL